MAYKDILVHVDTSARAAARVDLAIGLATAHDAHLTGLFVRQVEQIPEYVLVELGPRAIDLQQRQALEIAVSAARMFDTRVKRAGIAAEWRTIDDDPSATLLTHARYADLVVLGQADPSVSPGRGEAALTDHVVLGAGRPVLIVPYAGDFDEIGRRVLVAWNASREAARAVADALPLLRKARRVVVLSVNPISSPGGHGETPGADICRHLARHGVTAEASQVVADDVGVGDLLLSHAAAEACDLMVMGAYGRSRLRELVLGGATRHVLRHMTIPVLMGR